MRKLLAANFSRLQKDRIFRCILVAVVVLSFVNIFNSASSYEAMLSRGVVVSLDDFYFNQAPLMGIFLGLFTSLYLGTEYSDGTLRNKLVIGHKREQIYLSNFLVCAVASVVVLAVWLVVSALGFFLIGPLEMGVSGFLSYIAVAVSFMVSFAALFTFIGSLSSNKAMTIIYTALTFVMLAITASGFYDRLCELEFNGGMAYIDGQFVMQEPTQNPLYLSGTVRTICQCILELMPSGQALLLNEVAIENSARAVFLSVIVTICALALGCRLFRRKDIK